MLPDARGKERTASDRTTLCPDRPPWRSACADVLTVIGLSAASVHWPISTKILLFPLDCCLLPSRTDFARSLGLLLVDVVLKASGGSCQDRALSIAS